MRKASKVLGIVGGSLSLAWGVLMLIGGILLMTLGSGFMSNMMDYFGRFNALDMAPEFMLDFTTQFGGIVVIIVSLFTVGSGVVGLIGGTMVPKNNVTAGVLMIVAAGVSLILAGGFITTVLFTLGGIFALVKEKQPQVPPSDTPAA